MDYAVNTEDPGLPRTVLIRIHENLNRAEALDLNLIDLSKVRPNKVQLVAIFEIGSTSLCDHINGP